MLIIAALNTVLMVPSCFFMKARLPPRTPPPLRSLKRPWQESKYICLVVGSCLNMMMYVSLLDVHNPHIDNQPPIPVLQRPTLHHLQQHLPHHHLLFDRHRPSWLIPRSSNVWLLSRRIRRMARILHFRIQPHHHPPRILDGCTATRRSGGDWDPDVWVRKWGLVGVGSC
jgi:hypothetical protein